ncbi:MAG: RadC family protein [Clostridia bacterium]|nr:RadC family protein [Clostridia bacterium]
MEKKNIHKDHRQRVRARYLSEGFGSMAEHNIVELLLFFGIPYKDTNPIAHELIETFGSLNGILDAPVEELMKIDGIGENAATLLKLTRDIALKYSDAKAPGLAEKEYTDITDFIRSKYIAETREIVYLIAVDAHGRAEHCTKICEGTIDRASIDNRTVVESVIRFNSKNVIIAHNHPHGFAAPSAADIEATAQLKDLLSSIGVNLVDHVIVSRDDVFSMAKNRKFSGLF